MIIVIDNNTTGKRMYLARIIECLRSNEVSHVVVDSYEEFAAVRAQGTGIILSGSATHVPDMGDKHRKLNLAAINSKLPVLGICFGAQFICTHFGGQIERMDKFICDNRTVSSASGKPFKARFCARYRLSHVPEKTFVPLYFARLNNQKSVVGFRHKSRPIFATLFHPEYDESTHHFILDFVYGHNQKTYWQ